MNIDWTKYLIWNGWYQTMHVCWFFLFCCSNKFWICLWLFLLSSKSFNILNNILRVRVCRCGWKDAHRCWVRAKRRTPVLGEGEMKHTGEGERTDTSAGWRREAEVEGERMDTGLGWGRKDAGRRRVWIV
jgi:hypothetical protein